MGNPGINEFNKTYGDLLVIGKGMRRGKGGEIYWECLCSCGVKCLIMGTSLRRRRIPTTSCGCKRKNWIHIGLANATRNPAGVSGLSVLFNSYKSNAKQRNLTFNLSKEQIETLSKRNCFYCNAPPSMTAQCAGRRISAAGISWSKYIYNGIDRINNNNGYCLDNCVTCCNICNIAKRAMSTLEFKHWIYDVYNNLINQGKIK